MSTPRSGNREFVTALARGLSVISAFDGDNAEMTLSQVAERSKLNAAAARRALITLGHLGYVRQNGRSFVLTSKVMSLGAAYLSSMNLKFLIQPLLEKLSDEFHDASSFAVLEGNDVLYLAHMSAPRPTRLRQNLGSRLPAHATSLGLAILAFDQPARVETYLRQAPFPRYTPRTPSSVRELRQILAEVRRNRFASVTDTLEHGSVAVAVPVLSRDGVVLGAINCSTQTTRVTEKQMVSTRLPRLWDAATNAAEAFARFPALRRSLGSG